MMSRNEGRLAISTNSSIAAGELINQGESATFGGIRKFMPPAFEKRTN